jgi:leucyl/phenylalanyl-tRNA--protein transferase
MPLFRLSDRVEFPPAWLARSDGLLCIGGDLDPARLILAYKMGIFPWFSENEPILWWSPDPRLVLYPDQVRVSRSLKKKLKKNVFDIRINTGFERVITACAQPRQHRDEGTWLTPDMIQAYNTLHHMGVAHSVEAWKENHLVGGLYGIGMGRAFFGESMFSWEPDASKTALISLANHLKHYDFHFIDCQVTTDHLLSMGATEISRDVFLDCLENAITESPPQDMWAPGRLAVPEEGITTPEKHLSHPS